METEIKKEQLIQELWVSMLKGRKKDPYYSGASLSIKGYKVEIPDVHYKELDLAVEGLKERIVKACLDFKIPMEELDEEYKDFDGFSEMVTGYKEKVVIKPSSKVKMRGF